MRIVYIEINQKTSFDFIFRKVFNYNIGNPYAFVSASNAAVESSQSSILVAYITCGNRDSITFVFVVNSTDETLSAICDGAKRFDSG